MDTQSKFTVIYSFKVVDGREADFINSWTELTQLIYEFEGSYGSRLHKVNDQLFIGYAQWPNKERYDQAGNDLPETADKLRQLLRECSEIKKEYELGTVVSDLLQEEQHISYRQKFKQLNQ